MNNPSLLEANFESSVEKINSRYEKFDVGIRVKSQPKTGFHSNIYLHNWTNSMKVYEKINSRSEKFEETTQKRILFMHIHIICIYTIGLIL